MTQAQTIQLKLSTCRQRLNELLQIETRSTEQEAEMVTLTKEVSALDMNQIELLNQIGLLVQSRSPLGRKTADKLFKMLKALEHECENESDKD